MSTDGKSDGDRRNGIEQRRGGERRGGDRRQEARLKKQIPCELVAQGQRQRALVLDVSAHGLFVRTTTVMDPGAQVGVELQLPGHKEKVELRAVVARSYRVPPHLALVAAPGVGLRITSAPPEYDEFVAGLTS